MERASVGFRNSIGNLSDTRDEFLVAFLDNTVIGFAGIHRLGGKIGEMAHVGEIGIAVHPDFQQKGTGTKLLETCVNLAEKQGLERLEADTLSHNVAMKRILTKLDSSWRASGIDP